MRRWQSENQLWLHADLEESSKRRQTGPKITCQALSPALIPFWKKCQKYWWQLSKRSVFSTCACGAAAMTIPAWTLPAGTGAQNCRVATPNQESHVSCPSTPLPPTTSWFNSYALSDVTKGADTYLAQIRILLMRFVSPLSTNPQITTLNLYYDCSVRHEWVNTSSFWCHKGCCYRFITALLGWRSNNSISSGG